MFLGGLRRIKVGPCRGYAFGMSLRRIGHCPWMNLAREAINSVPIGGGLNSVPIRGGLLEAKVENSGQIG